MLDSKTRHYRPRYVVLLWEIKKSIGADFKVIQQQTRLIASNIELRDAVERLRAGAAAQQRRTAGGAANAANAAHHAGRLVALGKNGRFLLVDAMLDLRTSLCTVLGQARVVTAIAPELSLDSYPVQLEQVLASLITNAVLHGYAGRPQGTVTVTAEALPDGVLRLAVHDDGVGIAREHLGRVFDPLFTTRLGHGGSGLGLHIAYNLVHTVLGGTIEVRSDPGQGACLTLLLPQVAPQPAAHDSAGNVVH
ncbi:MAG TPA: ATP-binding protein [Burkholderiaceae bacterium]|nr:ATP-binding protein [Burkholderiaceae bacterium]